jgi:hypothetical protein
VTNANQEFFNKIRQERSFDRMAKV